MGENDELIIEAEKLGKEESGLLRGVNYTRKDYDQMWLQEQPYYYHGITPENVIREREHLNNHLSEFFNGTYVPLWKQDLNR